MIKAVELARRLAPLPRPILLVGQSGVGKGLLARFIHVQSGRAGDFVAVVGGELSESLLHDQLAGHEAGAFTGAQRRVRGAFERAHKGTLFLDELPLWSHAAQSAVLRAVDERLITRLGGERELPLDCRVVLASNQSLDALVSSGRLMSDLRWRIGEFVIEIPPLAGRAVDVAALSYYFLDEVRAELGRPGPVLFDPGALERLVTYHWPGNVRQLRGVVEWSWTLATIDAAERIGLTHLPASVLRDEAPRVPLNSGTRHALSRWAYDRAGRSRKAAAQLLGLHPNTIDNHRRAATG
jgi:DNA-binding NtrC family response regulator